MEFTINGQVFKTPVSMSMTGDVLETLVRRLERARPQGLNWWCSFTIDGHDSEVQAEAALQRLAEEDRILTRAEEIRKRRAATAPLGFG